MIGLVVVPAVVATLFGAPTRSLCSHDIKPISASLLYFVLRTKKRAVKTSPMCEADGAVFAGYGNSV